MQDELTGLDKIKNDVQVMKLRNKLNKRLTKYVIFKIQEDLITLKKELRKAHKANKKAGKSEISDDFLEDLKVFETIGSSPTGALIQKITDNDIQRLQLLFEQPLYEIRSKVRNFVQKSVLTPTLFDTAFKEEFGAKTILPKEFKDAEESYITRISGKIFDEEKFSPEKGKEKTLYLEKCRKDYKKTVTRGLILAPVTIPATIIILTGIGTFAAGAGAVLGGAWIWEKLSVANARMLGKKPRADVRHTDKFFGRKPKWFGDYKRVAFPVLQSSIAFTAAGAFVAFGTNDKDTQIHKLPAPIEQSLTPKNTPAKDEVQNPAKKDGAYIMSMDKLTKVGSTSLQNTNVSKGVSHVKKGTAKSIFATLNEQSGKEKIKSAETYITLHMSKMKNNSMG